MASVDPRSNGGRRRPEPAKPPEVGRMMVYALARVEGLSIVQAFAVVEVLVTPEGRGQTTLEGILAEIEKHRDHEST
jgi:hypothetical protein